MTCESPKVCGECDGCLSTSAEHEAKLDKVQIMIEDHIADTYQKTFDVVEIDFGDYVENLAARIVNDLEDNGWLNLDNVDAGN